MNPGAIAVVSGFYINADDTHLITEVSCEGTESRLVDCVYSLADRTCGALEDAAVVCQGTHTH